MLLFLRKIIIFLIPLMVIFAFPAFIIFIAREYTPINDVVAIQQKTQSAIFGFGYDDISLIPYKEKLVAVKDPTVIALGTSRVMQIRKEFFIEPDRFVNAGGTGKSFGDIELFIKDLPKDSNIKVLILGIDQSLLYNPYDSGTERTDSSGLVRVVKLFATMSRRMYLDYFSHKYLLSDLVTKSKSGNNIGLPAIIYNNGFREDGSYMFGQAMQNPNRVQVVSQDIKAQAAQVANANLYPADAEEDKLMVSNLIALRRILDDCKEKDITVIGFAPPYPQSVYDAMKASSGLNYKVAVVAPQKIKEVFTAYGQPFFDFSPSATFEGKEEDAFVDSIHATDVSQLRMTIYMADHVPVFNTVVDKVKLKNLLQTTTTAFLPL